MVACRWLSGDPITSRMFDVRSCGKELGRREWFAGWLVRKSGGGRSPGRKSHRVTCREVLATTVPHDLWPQQLCGIWTFSGTVASILRPTAGKHTAKKIISILYLTWCFFARISFLKYLKISDSISDERSDAKKSELSQTWASGTNGEKAWEYA